MMPKVHYVPVRPPDPNVQIVRLWVRLGDKQCIKTTEVRAA